MGWDFLLHGQSNHLMGASTVLRGTRRDRDSPRGARTVAKSGRRLLLRRRGGRESRPTDMAVEAVEGPVSTVLVLTPKRPPNGRVGAPSLFARGTYGR